MEYSAFVEKVRELTDEILTDQKVTTREVLKNNGLRFQGISIAEEGYSAAPTIYLEQFYDRYQSGETIEDIVDQIIEIYEDNKTTQDFDKELFEDYAKTKRNLYLKAVNTEKNADLLKDVPSIPFLDLALIPYILIKNVPIGCASAVIHRGMLSLWNRTEEELLADAMQNMKQSFQYDLTPVYDVLKDSLPMQSETTESVREVPMYVLLPKGMLYGAALMAVEETMEEAAAMLGSDLFVLPSSIHEVIVVPAEENADRAHLDSLVKSVNETTLSKEEILSDHAYYYKRGVGYQCS